MPRLFDQLTLRSITLRNRIGVAPMGQGSCVDGLATDWHLVHLGSRAIGGAGLVIMEATAIAPEGRTTPNDHGLWSDKHIEPLRRLTKFIHQHGSVAGIQIAHAGRKANPKMPWTGEIEKPKNDPPWRTVAPSAIPYAQDMQTPHALTKTEISSIVTAFAAAARRSHDAGFRFLEIHAAHGYLIHSFLSPISNHRTDEFGGDFSGRSRFLMDVIRAVQNVWPSNYPIAVRISCTDWIEGGWTLEDSVQLSRHLKDAGIDLVDCSTGGMLPNVKIPVGPHYQVPMSETIRREAKIPTASVGLITNPIDADAIIQNQQADLILIGRESLRDPYWPLHAAITLNEAGNPIPRQYLKAFT